MNRQNHKGIHDIPRARSVLSQRPEDPQAALTAELARLEHERARLERGLRLQLAVVNDTERRIERVAQQIQRLDSMRDEIAGDDRVRRARMHAASTRVAVTPQATAAGSADTPRRTVVLEY